MVILNSEGGTTAAAPKEGGGERKRKRRREASSSSSSSGSRPLPAKWMTEKEQKTYSSKLIEALRRVHRGSSSQSLEPPRSCAVREVADRVLAVAARGRTRWSRAILARRTLKLKARKLARTTGDDLPKAACASTTSSLTRAAEKRKLPVLERKVRVLGRLVPGCRKLSFPTILEEASDYIPALEMQVRALTAMVEILSAAGRSGVVAGDQPAEPM